MAQPADDVQYHDEVVVLEAGHVCPQDVGLDLQLDVLQEGDRRRSSGPQQNLRREREKINKYFFQKKKDRS